MQTLSELKYPFYTILKYTALQINNIVYMRVIWNSRLFFIFYFFCSPIFVLPDSENPSVGFCFPQLDKRHNRKHRCVLFTEMFHLWEILSFQHKLVEHKSKQQKTECSRCAPWSQLLHTQKSHAPFWAGTTGRLWHPPAHLCILSSVDEETS